MKHTRIQLSEQPKPSLGPEALLVTPAKNGFPLHAENSQLAQDSGFAKHLANCCMQISQILPGEEIRNFYPP
jgi:hypothetical protein